MPHGVAYGPCRIADFCRVYEEGGFEGTRFEDQIAQRVSRFNCVGATATCNQPVVVDPPDTGTPDPDAPCRPFIDQVGAISFATSDYGLNIPIVFGSDKLTGNIIWQDQIETHQFEIDDECFTYQTISFAIGLAAGEINGILRLWMGDKLLVDNVIGTDGTGIAQQTGGAVFGTQVNLIDPDSPLAGLPDEAQSAEITIFTGSEIQVPSEAIIDNEGFDNSPAYRGLAYIVFENFVLTQGNVPDIYAEVTSNTEADVPRLFGDVSSSTPFSILFANWLYYDVDNDRIHVFATGSGGDGVASFVGNTLEEFQTSVWDNVIGENTGNVTRAWPTSKGTLVFPVGSAGNSVPLGHYDPFTNTYLNELGEASGSLTHTGTSTVFPDVASQMMQAQGSRDIVTDLFFVVGLSGNEVTIIEFDHEFRSMRRVGPTILDTLQSESILAPLTLKDNAGQQWADGTSANGQFMFAFTYDDSADGWNVRRYTVRSEDVDSVENATAVVHGFIPSATWGDGFTMDFDEVYTDQIDGTFILMASPPGASSRSPKIIKYNPLTNGVVAVRDLPHAPTSERHMMRGFTQADQVLGYLTQNGNVLQINTRTLDVEVLPSLADEGLPSRSFPGQWFNGYENSITYVSGTAGQKITKVFLKRLNRQTVELPEVVRTLLEKIGIEGNRVAVSSINALSLNGYTVPQVASLRTIFSELAQVFRFDVVESDGKILYQARGGSSTATIDEKYMGDLGGDAGWLRETQENEFGRIRKLALTYRDLDREYARNVQTIQLPKINDTEFGAEAAISVDVPIVLRADDAKQLAEIILYAKNVYNSTYEMNLPPRFLQIDPGDVVTANMDDGRSIDMRVRQVTKGDDNALQMSLTKEDPAIYTDQVNLFGALGRFDPSVIPLFDARIDPCFIQVPYIEESEAEILAQYHTYLTLLPNGDNVTFDKPVTVTLNADAGKTFTLDPPNNLPTWGVVISPLDTVPDYFGTDFGSVMRVKMVSFTGGTPTSATIEQLMEDPTRNLCASANELFQFANVTDEGNNVYRFDTFFRARNGTEENVAAHFPGDKFMLFNSDSVMKLQIPAEQPNQFIATVGFATNNPFQRKESTFLRFLNLRPFSVNDNVQFSHVSGDVNIDWQRRTRYGGQLMDGTPTVPLNEFAEEYDITLAKDLPENLGSPDTYLRKVRVTTNSFVYTAADQTADGYDNTMDTLYFTIRQLGGQAGEEEAIAFVEELLPI